MIRAIAQLHLRGLSQIPTDGLMLLVQDGDALAFEALYCRMVPIIRGFLAARARFAMPLDDAVQEVFCRVWKQQGRFVAGKASAKTYLVAISRNVLREILRDTYSALPALEDSVAKAIVDSRQRENSNASDIADELHRARSVLSDRQATAITLVYDEGLTYAEAAKGLGCTEKALRCRVDAARCRMLSYLRPLTQDLTAKRPSLAAPRNGRP